ncbi:hypothetical protein ACONDI_02076 [Natranaerofaba carboxydovora]|nr:hypothetical protein ACONDI_02076 [Natranaerofaba carboxydovora]
MVNLTCPRCNSENIEQNKVNKNNIISVIIILIVFILFLMPVLSYFLAVYYSVSFELCYLFIIITGVIVLFREFLKRHNFCKQCLYKWDNKKSKQKSY